MPCISVSAELVPTPEGPRVYVYIDGRRAAASGPFSNFYRAQASALELTDEISTAVRATVLNWHNASRDCAIAAASGVNLDPSDDKREG